MCSKAPCTGASMFTRLVPRGGNSAPAYVLIDILFFILFRYVSLHSKGQTADILFTNNVIVRNGISLSGDPPAIDVSPSNVKPATVHRNLQIIDNVIHLHRDSKAPVVALKSVDGMELAGNTIYSPGRPLNTSDMVTATADCSGVNVANSNTVITTGAGGTSPQLFFK